MYATGLVSRICGSEGESALVVEHLTKRFGDRVAGIFDRERLVTGRPG